MHTFSAYYPRCAENRIFASKQTKVYFCFFLKGRTMLKLLGYVIKDSRRMNKKDHGGKIAII